jgi:hypothetical protein
VRAELYDGMRLMPAFAPLLEADIKRASSGFADLYAT